jgi:hypothetical protein
LPRLKNERAIGLLGWLFCLELCRCCFLHPHKSQIPPDFVVTA